jgi:hypothetical protein
MPPLPIWPSIARPGEIDWERIYTLIEESRMIARAIWNFDNGGIIVQMAVSGQPPQEGIPPDYPVPNPTALVNTAYMRYPEPMVEALKVEMSRRKDEILAELVELGVVLPEHR